MQAFLAKDLLLQLGEGCLRQLAKRPEGRRLMIGFTFLVETKAMWGRFKDKSAGGQPQTRASSSTTKRARSLLFHMRRPAFPAEDTPTAPIVAAL